MISVVNQMREQLQSLAPLSVDIIDDSAKHAGHAGARDGGGHFRLRIVGNCFTDLGVLARHRLVYDALGPLMRQQIHALSISALTPLETQSQDSR